MTGTSDDAIVAAHKFLSLSALSTFLSTSVLISLLLYKGGPNNRNNPIMNAFYNFQPVAVKQNGVWSTEKSPLLSLSLVRMSAKLQGRLKLQRRATAEGLLYDSLVENYSAQLPSKSQYVLKYDELAMHLGTGSYNGFDIISHSDVSPQRTTGHALVLKSRKCNRRNPEMWIFLEDEIGDGFLNSFLLCHRWPFI